MRSSSTGSNRATKSAIVRHTFRAATRRIIEGLEGRTMMAANPFDFHNEATFTPTTSNLADSKSGPLAKGGSALVSLYSEYTKFVKKGGNRYQFDSSQSQYVTIGRNVLAAIRTRGSIDALVTEVKQMGGVVVDRSRVNRTMDAFIPLNQVANLTSQSEILHLRPQLAAYHDSEGSVGNDAERSEKTQFVIPAFGVDGTGVTVGALSDSFGDGSTSVATGDLPAGVNVIADQPGTDEGRAMLELIHDLAPGADLAFSTTGDTVTVFAQGIRNLRENAHANVIVDDVRFPDEPFFGEGVIDKAIDDVVDDGAIYFSSQGNYGFAGYSEKTNWVKETAEGGLATDFDPGPGVDTKLRVHFNRAGSLNFQYDNPYDGVVADISADVDVYLYRNGTLISSGTDDNFATGVPIERLAIPESGDYDIVIRLAKLEKGATAPTIFKFAQRDSGLFDSRVDVEYPGYNSSTWGHSSAVNNIPVGAVDNAASNAFGAVSKLSSQDFSSAGPSVRIFDANGNRLGEPVVVQTPLVSGIQGTNTSVPGFAPFFGTSAAAPNVAAIAALLVQLNPNANSDDIKNALIVSAKDNPLNGAKAGAYDIQAGYGLVDALKAASFEKPSVAVSTFDVPMVNAGGTVDSVTINFNVPVTGVDIDDFILNRDGTKTNRFSGSEIVTASNGNKTYTISGLRAATTTLGIYTLTLRAGRTDIVDASSDPAAGNVVSFGVTLRAAGDLKADTLDDGQIRLRWSDTNRLEDNYRIQRSTTTSFSNAKNIDVGANATEYVDSGLIPGTVYYYRIRASKGSRFGDAAKVSAVASSAGEIFVDDSSAKFKGTWVTNKDADAFLQSEHRAGETPLLGTTPNTATYASTSIAKGSYFIYARYIANAKNATNATYQILQNGKLLSTVTIDQTQRGGGFVLLGKFISISNGALSVRLTTAGADGTVRADAIRFLPADEATVASFEALKKSKKKSTQSVASDVL